MLWLKSMMYVKIPVVCKMTSTEKSWLYTEQNWGESERRKRKEKTTLDHTINLDQKLSVLT